MTFLHRGLRVGTWTDESVILRATGDAFGASIPVAKWTRHGIWVVVSWHLVACGSPAAFTAPVAKASSAGWVTPTPTPVAAAPTAVPDTSTPVPDTPTRRPDTPTLVSNTPTRLPDTPTRVPDTPTRVPDTPTRVLIPVHRPPLDFYWVLDQSGSMQGDKIATLNQGVRSATALIARAASSKGVEVMMRVVLFDSQVYASQKPTRAADFVWRDLQANGQTMMGAAFRTLAQELRKAQLIVCGPPPVIVLASDGMPSDDAYSGLQNVMAERDGKRAVRLAVAIGRDADRRIMQAFIGRDAVRPLEANNAQALVDSVQWISTEVVASASDPRVASRSTSAATGCSDGADVVIPPTPSPRSLAPPTPAPTSTVAPVQSPSATPGFEPDVVATRTRQPEPVLAPRATVPATSTETPTTTILSLVQW